MHTCTILVLLNSVVLNLDCPYLLLVFLLSHFNLYITSGPVHPYQFQFLIGVSGVLFHFCSISNRYSEDPDQTPRSAAAIWVCTVCICPKNGTLGLYGLILSLCLSLSLSLFMANNPFYFFLLFIFFLFRFFFFFMLYRSNQ